MSPPRFYCRELSDGAVTLTESESRHALLSLRLGPGATLELFDGQGHLARGRLREPAEQDSGAGERRSRRRARLAEVIIEELSLLPAPSHRLTLVSAGCKGARLDWLVEKCTELGVTRLKLAEFERSVVRVGPGHVEKLRRIAIEACKQCGRLWLPEIDAGMSLLDAVSGPAARLLLVGDRSADAVTPGELLGARHQPADVCAVIGPEGGLSASELALLRGAGGRLLRLAEHTLRVETAAIALASIWAAAGRGGG